MKRLSNEEQERIEQMPLKDFLHSYNKNMPEQFPRVTVAMLEKFKATHTSLFKYGDLWSLNLHRKRIMDWLPLSGEINN